MNNYLNTFLQTKLDDCNDSIRSKRKKIYLIKIFHYTLIAISTTGSSVVGLLSAFYNPSVPCACLSMVVTLCTFLSIKFNTEGRMRNLGEHIQKLNIIKNELAYITSCNGTLTDQECKSILDQLGNLIV